MLPYLSLQLKLPDAIGVALGDLSSQRQPFVVHHDDIDVEDTVAVFKCVIGQDGKMIDTGDYVKLTHEHYEVWNLSIAEPTSQLDKPPKVCKMAKNFDHYVMCCPITNKLLSVYQTF